MIYWEKVHPLLSDVRLISCDTWDFDGGDPDTAATIDWVSTDSYETLIWSRPLNQQSVLKIVRYLEDRKNRDPGHTGDYLILCRPVENDFEISVIAAVTGGVFNISIFGTSPPWPDPVVDSLPAFLEKVEHRIRTTAKLSPTEMKKVRQTKKGYCSVCGLTRSKHVPHAVQPASLFSSPRVLGWKDFEKAHRDQYQGALQLMTEAEMLEMPLPVRKLYLQVLKADAKRRINKPKPEKTRFDRLLSEDPF